MAPDMKCMEEPEQFFIGELVAASGGAVATATFEVKVSTSRASGFGSRASRKLKAPQCMGFGGFPSKETTGEAGDDMLASTGDRASSGAAAGLDQRLPGRACMVPVEQGTVFNHTACIEEFAARDFGHFQGYVLAGGPEEDAAPLQSKGHYDMNSFNYEGARPPGLGSGWVTSSPDTCFNHASTDALARWAWHDV